MFGRRKFLGIAAGAGAVAASGVVVRGYRQNVFFRNDDEPYEAWRDYESGKASGPLSLVRAAVLAANPHNTQPWRFRISERSVEIHADLDRNLGSFDPFRRELHLGLGCALENIVSAAPSAGLDARVEPFPDDAAPTFVARVALTPRAGLERSPSRPIESRHTHRGPYLPGRVVGDSTQRTLLECADDGVTISLAEANSDRGRAFVDSTLYATDRIVADSEMTADSDRWYRHEWSDIVRLRDGVTVQTAGLPGWLTALALIGPRPSQSTSHSAWARSTRETHCKTAPLFGVIAVRDRYDKKDMLRAGAVWQRLHLKATELGLAMQPLNQMVEIGDRDRQLGRHSDAEGRMRQILGAEADVTFAFRCGYAEKPARPSARRPARAVLI